MARAAVSSPKCPKSTPANEHQPMSDRGTHKVFREVILLGPIATTTLKLQPHRTLLVKISLLSSQQLTLRGSHRQLLAIQLSQDGEFPLDIPTIAMCGVFPWPSVTGGYFRCSFHRHRSTAPRRPGMGRGLVYIEQDQGRKGQQPKKNAMG